MDENGGWFNMTIFETLIAALRGFGCLCKIQKPRKPLKIGQKEMHSTISDTWRPLGTGNLNFL